MNTPTNDPIVAEVRAARDKHAAQFGYDLTEIFRDLRERQQSSGRKYVRYAPRPPVATTTTSSMQQCYRVILRILPITATAESLADRRIDREFAGPTES